MSRIERERGFTAPSRKFICHSFEPEVCCAANKAERQSILAQAVSIAGSNESKPEYIQRIHWKNVVPTGEWLTLLEMGGNIWAM